MGDVFMMTENFGFRISDFRLWTPDCGFRTRAGGDGVVGIKFEVPSTAGGQNLTPGKLPARAGRVNGGPDRLPAMAGMHNGGPDKVPVADGRTNGP
jgi:hypothetical protein